MERWIQMHYQIKEREEAIQIARNRELFYWISGFYLTSMFGCISVYQRTRRPISLLPMVPLSFVMGYYADLAYGSKIHRIKGNYEMRRRRNRTKKPIPNHGYSTVPHIHNIEMITVFFTFFFLSVCYCLFFLLKLKAIYM